MVTEKVINEWIARLEEAVKNYHIHKNNDWLEQMQISRNKIKEIFKQQQKQIELLNGYYEGACELAERHRELKLEGLEDRKILQEQYRKVHKYEVALREIAEETDTPYAKIANDALSYDPKM